LDRRLGGSQSRSGRGGEEKNSQPPPAVVEMKLHAFLISAPATLTTGREIAVPIGQEFVEDVSKCNSGNGGYILFLRKCAISNINVM
jgi:hypothetical protein